MYIFTKWLIYSLFLKVSFLRALLWVVPFSFDIFGCVVSLLFLLYNAGIPKGFFFFLLLLLFSLSLPNTFDIKYVFDISMKKLIFQ